MRPDPEKPLSDGYDAVVLGGGVIGWSCALDLRAEGLEVAVVDAHLTGAATSAAAGMLAPVTEAHFGEEPLLALNLTSAAIYPDYVARLEGLSGIDVGYRRCGTLTVARDRDDNEALARLFEFQQRCGLEVERLGSRECRSLEPNLTPRIRGGVYVAGDHQVDNRALHAALRSSCAAAGVASIEATVSSVKMSNERVEGLELTDGTTLACRYAVIAAGAWAGSIGGVPVEARAPIRPVKGQTVQLSSGGAPAILGHNLRGLDVYLVPRPDGRVVLGATVEERGFDTDPSAGAVHRLLRDAYELVPGIVECNFDATTVGLRPGTPDNAPVIGPSPVEGLVYAVGHFRNGILLAPITARAVADHVMGREPDDVTKAFRLARFHAAETRA